ncbi:hypothetical protein KR100_11680 [Synechococcus sp. KORDI-100]|uniref:ARC6/PARC6 family protein n=1 Tax=Synechococcus sp. KORDI-100 TaxID=1280380 RepID=UPI0004E054C0|nr:IMS domain-containing protein [Synechococcus sp. KORDI-100]AII44014.1 hypothetical protein KR100_11680 [Synechococcus sp. KORDI-100]
MDLPIDHFRLLGVSPSAAADAILRKLQSRCDSPPDQGFTHEVLIQRDELLRQSADLLTDSVRRSEYEAQLLDLSQHHPGDTVGLDLPSSSEAAGLLLLWEAGSALEAFQMACQGLQPPQAPALGSGREADLTLLAALACRDASKEEQGQRRYESAAQVLAAGIELQRRMGKLPDQLQALERDLESLLPYRILDLLSRDLSDQESHQQGLRLLDRLVKDRGGLEGAPEAAFGQEDFEPFFKQIRRFLTVQEQIDLFSNWQLEGSGEAGFLAVLALTASGFSRRKPELLEQARDQVKSLAAADLDPMPLLGCLDLLLGNVASAGNHFLSVRDRELRLWLDQHPGDQLSAQCEYCRVWLERDVLPGYRDVEASDVDLDAWFADRDVQAYVERLDRQEARRSDPAPVSSGDWPNLFAEDSASASEESAASALGEPDGLSEDSEGFHIAVPRSVLIAIGSGLAVLGVLAAVISSRQNTLDPLPEPSAQLDSGDPSDTEEPVDPVDPAPETDVEDTPAQPDAALKPEPKPREQLKPKPLTADQPSEANLQALIQGWLDLKAASLAAEPDQGADLSVVARDHMVQKVLQEQAADASAGLSKAIDASVTSVELVSRTPQRIEVLAQIAYSDKTINGVGAVTEQTPPGTLSVRYIFGRDGDQWRLQAYIPASEG